MSGGSRRDGVARHDQVPVLVCLGREEMLLKGTEAIDIGGLLPSLCLAALAIAEGATIEASVLADMIWQGDPPTTWAAALRSHLSKLRSVLNGVGLIDSLITVKGVGYRLVLPERVSVDLLELEAAAIRSAECLASEPRRSLAEATQEWRKGLKILVGVNAGWVRDAQARADAALVQLLSAAAEAANILGEFQSAERLSRELIGEAPMLEHGYRQRMKALVGQGNGAAALRTYEECRRFLRETLGASPGSETESLMVELLALESGAPVSVEGWRPWKAPDSSARRWQATARYALEAAARATAAGAYEDLLGPVVKALDTLRAAGDPDPSLRRDLSIALGEAERALGVPESSQRLLEVFDEADGVRDGCQMADAMIAMRQDGSFTDEAFVYDAEMVRLEKAVAALPRSQAGRRARLLCALATGSAWRQDCKAVEEILSEALDLATGMDPLTVAHVLGATRRAISGTSDAARKFALERELFAIGSDLDAPDVLARSALWRFESQVEEGNGQDLEHLLQIAAAHTGGLRAIAHHHHLAYNRSTLALLRGEFDRAEHLIESTTDETVSGGLEYQIVEAVRLVQMWSLLSAQGRQAELAQSVISFFDQPELPQWQSMVALGYHSLDRRKEAEAALRAYLDVQEVTGPTMVSPFGLPAMVAPIAADLARPDLCSRLLNLLLPHQGRGTYVGHFAGPIDLAIGLLERAIGDYDAGTEHLDSAATLCRRLGAPWWEHLCVSLR